MRPVDLFKIAFPNAHPNYVVSMDRCEGDFIAAQVTTPLRLAHMLAQGAAETTNYTALRENMNYRAERLLEVFGVGKHSAGITAQEAQSLAHKPELIAERVYGLGNPSMAKRLGNTQPGDGWRFRGGGDPQMTGRYNYTTFGKKIGVDLAANPDLVAHPDYAFKLALAYWTLQKCNAFADANNILAISRAINLGDPHSDRTPNGYSTRRAAFNRLFPLCRDNPVSFTAGAAKPPGKPVGGPQPSAPIGQKGPAGGVSPATPKPAPAPAAGPANRPGIWAALFAGFISLFNRKQP